MPRPAQDVECQRSRRRQGRGWWPRSVFGQKRMRGCRHPRRAQGRWVDLQVSTPFAGGVLTSTSALRPATCPQPTARAPAPSLETRDGICPAGRSVLSLSTLYITPVYLDQSSPNNHNFHLSITRPPHHLPPSQGLLHKSDAFLLELISHCTRTTAPSATLAQHIAVPSSSGLNRLRHITRASSPVRNHVRRAGSCPEQGQGQARQVSALSSDDDSSMVPVVRESRRDHSLSRTSNLLT